LLKLQIAISDQQKLKVRISGDPKEVAMLHSTNHPKRNFC
jgi:hypothetical protein